MKAVPALVFVWPWDQTRYPGLCRLSTWHLGVGHGDTLWIIPVTNRADVEALLCERLHIEGEAVGPSPDVPVPAWKGKDSLEVVEAPSGWIVIEHQKDKDGGPPKPRPYPVPLALIEKLWAEVWRTYPLDATIEYARIAEDTCRALHIRRYFRKVRGCWACFNADTICDPHYADKTASFDANKFQGGTNRRKDSLKYVYHPKKVLEHLGCIHDGSHTSRRLKDELPLQTVFSPV